MAKLPVVLPLPGLSLAKGLPAKVHSSEVVPPASQTRAESPHPLWLALVFPQLALETFLAQQKDGEQKEGERQDIAAVLVKQNKGRSVVHSASALAQAQGIKAGMPVNAAFALSPGLKVYPFNAQAENNRLQQLAVWGEQFTSKVSIQTPRALLLEVRGSIRLFGGLAKLQQHIYQQLKGQWQHHFVGAITPTPMASLLLACSGHDEVITQKQALRSSLGRLSVNHLPIELKKKQQLRNAGIRTLRDLFRLPKDALARRFGVKLTNYLDRTLGHIPDPLDFFASRESFEAFYEFPLEVHKTDLVVSIAQQLLEQLARFLRERDICINQCEFRLHHGKQSATTVIISVRQASRDPRHLLLLLKEQLERLVLKMSVKSVTLSAHDFLPFVPQHEALPGLFADGPAVHQGLPEKTNINHLLEQLQARLGHDAVRKLHSVNDHRPEYAYSVNHTTEKQLQSFHRQRPFWLLPEPQRLPQKYDQPWLNGRVRLLKGPERIEAGWWSGEDIRRDYYIAIDRHGCHLWVFQTVNEPRQWYLHGIFS